MQTFAGQNVLVVGAGKSGLAAAAFLRARGAAVVISDTKTDLDFPVVGQHDEASDGFDLIFQSPGVPLELGLFERARQRGVPVFGELELAAAELLGSTVGITGANGKTTTTALTGHIFTEAGLHTLVGGNIGTPITSLVERTRADGWNILELSSFQLETVDTFSAHIALVLNITPDHLDRHGTMDRYISAKARLVETLEVDGFAVLNAQEPNTRGLAKRTKAHTVWFNLDAPSAGNVAFDGERIWLGEEPLMPASSIPLVGRHNVENVMAAAAAAWLAGIAPETIARAVESFPGVEHRIEFVRELDGVRYYNDSKATNVDAAEKAIDAFAGGLWIILGGKDKHSDYTPLAARLADKAKGILLIGAAAPIIREHLTAANTTLPLSDCDTLDKAIRAARLNAAAGDVVLLSPACASFDQFQSYEHRGRIFKQLVKEL